MNLRRYGTFVGGGMRRHTILFLAANPIGTTALALGEDARAIQAELERSGYRDSFALETRWAAQPLDLLRELRKLKPAIVHFSGHGGVLSTAIGVARRTRRDVLSEQDESDGGPRSGLFFQAPNGQAQVVTAEALRDTFGAAGSSVKLVVLSACYSEVQSDALRAHVDCVIGMRGTIGDDAARSFAIGLYGGLGERESVAAAFRQGCAAISLEGLRDCDRPQLKTRDGIDPTQLVIGFSVNHADGGGSAAGDRRVVIGRDAIGNVITTGEANVVEAHVTSARHETPRRDPSTVDVVQELAAIRAILLSLGSEHARKIGRALDDADEEARKETDASKDELGRALDRALAYARTASAFAGATAKLAPHLNNTVAWLGSKWAAISSYLA